MFLITGATGNIGREIVKLMDARGLPQRLFVRDEQNARQLQGAENAEIALGDLNDPATFASALDGIEAIYLVTNETDGFLAALPGIVEAIDQTSVSRVVVLSALADRDSPSQFIRRHAQIDGIIREAAIPATILHPDWFMQNFAGYCAGGTIEFPGGTGKTAFVHTRDVAEVAILCMQQDGHAGRVYRPSGPEALSLQNVADRMSKDTGASVSFRDISPDRLAQLLEASGMPRWRATMQAGMTFAFQAGVVVPPSNDVQFLLGRPPRTFGEFVKELSGRAV